MEVKSRIIKALRGIVVLLIVVLALSASVQAQVAQVLDADGDGVLHGDAVLFGTDLGGRGVLDSALFDAEGTAYDITNIYGSFQDDTNLLYKTGIDLGITDDGTCSDDKGPNVSGIAQLPDGTIIFTVTEDCNDLENKNIYEFIRDEPPQVFRYGGTHLGITGRNSAIDAVAVHPDYPIDNRIFFSTNKDGLGDRAGSAEDRATNIFVSTGNGSSTIFATGQQLGVGSKKSTNIDALDVLDDGAGGLRVLFSTNNKANGTSGSAVDEDAPLKPSIIFISDLDETAQVYIPGEDFGIKTPTGKERPTNVDAFTLVHKADNCLTAGNPTQTDSDGDGLGNGCDNCPFVPNNAPFDPLSLIDQIDLDFDGAGDACDPVDEDTLPQLTANGPNAIDDDDDDGLSNQHEQLVTDTKINDADSDDDGIADGPNVPRRSGLIAGPDNCPNNPDPDQTNTDKFIVPGGDDLGDICDDDDDADDILDVVDNCQYVYNPIQANLDGDAFGNACDDDADGDGATVADGDCNDLDYQVKPVVFGGSEIPGNGIDDDCDDATLDIIDGLFIRFLMDPDWLPFDYNDDTVKGKTTITAEVYDDGTLLPSQPVEFELVDPMNHVSREKGTHTNDLSLDESADFDTSIFDSVTNIYTSTDGNITLKSYDYGGKISLLARAVVDGVTVQRELNVPRDSDDDGLPDKFENDNGTDPNSKDTDGDGTWDGDEGAINQGDMAFTFDALSMKEEYRGFKWGLLKSYNEDINGNGILDIDEDVNGNGVLDEIGSIGHAPGDVYQTPTLVQGVIDHFRGKADRRELFLKYSNFKGRDFALGYCFRNIGIDAYAVATGDIAENNLGDRNIDVLHVKMIDEDLTMPDGTTTYNGEEPVITRVGERHYSFKTFGVAGGQGNSFFYADANIFIKTMDSYSHPVTRNKPYRDGGSFEPSGANVPANSKLDALDSPLIEDTNDDGVVSGQEDKRILDNDIPDGDVWLPGIFSANLTAHDINGNLMIEAPPFPGADPADVIPTREFSNEQIRKHIYAHEIGHAIGFSHNTFDEFDVMYQYNSIWNRDGNLDGAGNIHNN